MKPSCSEPYDGAPASWVVASARPKSVAASVVSLPGSIQSRIRQSASTASTSGTWTPPASPSQRSPAASASKKPAGALVRVFMNAERPLLSRSLVAVQMSPPATGAVAATAEPTEDPATKAARLLARGDLDAARNWATRALLRDPEALEPRRVLAEVHARRGEYRRAFEHELVLLDRSRFSSAMVLRAARHLELLGDPLAGVRLVTRYQSELARVDPEGTRDTLAQLTSSHVLGTKAVVDAQAEEDAEAAAQADRDAAHHMRSIGDPLASAIVAKLPEMFE